MKRIFSVLALFLALSATLVARPIQDRRIEPAALDELFLGLGIDKNNAVAQTQREWLRKPGQERWDIQELSKEKRAFVLSWVKKHQFCARWEPSRKAYEKGVILGATTSRMETRLEYIKELWQKGVRFKEIVWLVGDRPLHKDADGLTKFCKTETEAAKYIWEHADLPKELRALPVLFVASPMKQGEGGALKRPTTEDTIFAWVKAEPDPCACFLVSDQPFCGYQFAVVKSALPDPFLFDIVGKEVDPESHPASAAIILDSIARWIYQENILNK